MSLMAAISNTSFIIGALFLCWMVYLDYKNSRIENNVILTFVVISLVFWWLSPSRWLLLLLMAVIFILALFLWNKGVLGGADTKILPLVVPFLGVDGVGTGIWALIKFLTIFAITGALYGLTAKLIMNKKEIPFMPAIALSYFIYWSNIIFS